MSTDWSQIGEISEQKLHSLTPVTCLGPPRPGGSGLDAWWKGPPERGLAPVILHKLLGQERRDSHLFTARCDEPSLSSSAVLRTASTCCLRAGLTSALSLGPCASGGHDCPGRVSCFCVRRWCIFFIIWMLFLFGCKQNLPSFCKGSYSFKS